jgi:hypothetical protein
MRAISSGQQPESLKNQMLVAIRSQQQPLFLMFLMNPQAQLAE